MEVQAETSREFWRRVLVAGGFTAIPRWSLDPETGTAEHEAKIPDDLVAALRRLAYELDVPLSSVLLDTSGRQLKITTVNRLSASPAGDLTVSANQATALTWAVEDVEAEVRELKARGVVFEHYDLPPLERRGDIHIADEFKTAWFKDPDGNILNIVED